MNDQEDVTSSSLSWREKAWLMLTGEPASRDELLLMLRAAEQRGLLDGEALSIIEGALLVSDMQAREIMVPQSQVVFVKLGDDPRKFLHRVIFSGHSRFPVIEDDPNHVIGILLAKDLLPLIGDDRETRFNLRDVLRPSTAIPESKRLNVLLQEFRTTKNHLAVVYDEYGCVSGIVTIEDVLEQIVGNIEDEFDLEEEGYFNQHENGSYTLKAVTPVDDFNEKFGTSFSDEEFDTIGGVVTNGFGHLPQRDEQVAIDGLMFRVLNADGRRIHLLELTLPDQTSV